MDDIVLPPENDFVEISKRPSEVRGDDIGFENAQNENEQKENIRPDSSSSQCSYQEMNMKEALHADEKEELAAELHDADVQFVSGDNNNGTPTNGEQTDLFDMNSMREQDPMNMSFYNNGTEQSPFENNPFKQDEVVDMNAVQQLPDDIDDDPIPENNIEQQQQLDFNHFAVEQNIDLLNNQFGCLDVNHQIESNAAHHDETTEHEELAKESASESEKKQSEYMKYMNQVDEDSTITKVVHEYATQITSVLNEDNGNHTNEYWTNTDNNAYGGGFGQQLNLNQNKNESENQGKTDAYVEQVEILSLNNENDVINKSELSVNASEFIPTTQTIDEAIGNVDAMFPNIPVETMALAPTSVDQFIESVQHAEPPKAEPLMTDLLIPQEIQETKVESIAENDVKPDSNIVNDLIGVAAVGTVAAVAAATVATVKSSKSPAKSTETKKPEVKGRTTTAPIKKTTSVASKVAATKSGKNIAFLFCFHYFRLVCVSD